MKNDLSKYFVPGVIDYTSRYVEVFKASINRDKGVSNSNDEVLINLSNISSIEKRQFKCGTYSKQHTLLSVRIPHRACYSPFMEATLSIWRLAHGRR